MCDDCGHVWCVSGCPSYRVERDPMLRGFCVDCGAPLYGDGERCGECKEEEDGTE